MHSKYNKRALPYLEGRLQVVFVALGEELVGIGCRPVLVEVFQVLQVRPKVLLSVATGPCEDELGLQLRRHFHLVKTHINWLGINLSSIC